MPSRYLIGIDLGTTTSSLSYFDTLDPDKGVEVLAISQYVAPGTMSQSDSLPSFCYLLSKNEYKKDEFRLPFSPYKEGDEPTKEVIGIYARQQIQANPEQVVHAAKSWLCHSGIDAQKPILPWHSDEIIGSKRMSPVQASSRFLQHLGANWNHQMALHEKEYSFNQQSMVITVPASFNELSTQLTLEAAKQAQLNPEMIHLLEEPQAAFYFWSFGGSASPEKCGLNRLKANARVKEAFALAFKDHEVQTVLVCDIGGGTSDFSLLEIREKRGDGFGVKRLRVSEHILLGGENIDLQLARALEERIKSDNHLRELSSRQWHQLLARARDIKEKALLVSDGQELDKPYSVSIAGSGSSLLASTISTATTPREIQSQVLDGFFPLCQANEKPEKQQLGLVEWGLPYAKDSAVSRHLAEFVKSQTIDAVLFTGGTLIAPMIQKRLLDLLASWQDFRPKSLDNSSLNLAVSQGAAWYGAALHFKQGQIQSAYPRTLFINVKREGEESLSLMSLIPKGYDGSEVIELEKPKIRMLLGQPASFEVSYSYENKIFPPGTLHQPQSIPGLKKLASLRTSFELDPACKTKNTKDAHEWITVLIRVRLTATRLLAIECIPLIGEQELPSTKLVWDLKFNVSESSAGTVEKQQDEVKTLPAHFSPKTMKQLDAKVEEVFGKPSASANLIGPNKLTRELERISGLDKSAWNLKQLRQCWELLKDRETKKARSEAHETVWLKLAAYCLRPGYGEALDSYRVGKLWSCYKKGMCYPKNKQVQHQWWLMWRRVAGGLSHNAQEQIFDKLAPAIRKEGANPELIMLAGALELVSMDRKVQIGRVIVKQLVKTRPQHRSQKIWALTRLASRTPLYAAADALIRPKFVEEWVQDLSQTYTDLSETPELAQFYVAACRKIGQRDLDISESCQQMLSDLLASHPNTKRFCRLLAEVVPLDKESEEHLYGDSLPAGFFVS